MDNIYTLNEVVQGMVKKAKGTYTVFLDIKKAYDSVA